MVVGNVQSQGLEILSIWGHNSHIMNIYIHVYEIYLK